MPRDSPVTPCPAELGPFVMLMEPICGTVGTKYRDDGMGGSCTSCSRGIFLEKPNRNVFSSVGLTIQLCSSVKEWLRTVSTVISYGKLPVAVRSDGSFAIRVALPDGQQTIAVQATAADGQQTRTIVPIVSRQTQHGPADAPAANGAPKAATQRRHTAESAS